MVSCLNSAVGSLLLLLFISSKQVYAEPTPTTTSENTESDLVVILKEPFNSKVKGHYLSSFHGKKYYAFQDIPYAIPPINERRFKESEPVQQWKGIKDTVTSTKVCPQFDLNRKFIGDEDCLVLSVYTPVNLKNITSLIPVLFWIHGGAFVVGNGGYEEYNPAYFMDEDIVVVTINYRLGVLGFLSTEDSAMPTNLGLKDQRLALEWTYVNIEQFGGNPENIVLMGESAGGTSIGYQLTDNYEKPLFTGAILVSGTSLCPGYQANPRKRAFEVGKKLCSSFNSTSSFDLLKVLQNVTAKEVTLAGGYGEQAKISDSWISVIPNDQRYFLLPTDSIEKGKFARVPLLFGFNSEEALSFFDVDTAMNHAKELDESPTDILGVLEVGQNNATEVVLKLKQVYTNSSFSKDLPAFVKSLTAEDPLVITLNKPQGSVIRGHNLNSYQGKQYYAYQEVPYAKPPVGEKRFKEPELPDPWTGELNATTSTKLCPQFQLTDGKLIGVEDCLVLNIYTPVNPKNVSKLLPVLFWIHGGNLTTGGGWFKRYNPAYFMDEDIVVVSINYRLGLLGFLTTEDSAIPINLGLKDQRLALEWTYANIKLFGGDPENIVLLGESSGADSVGYQLLGNYEKPLFTGAILASGTSVECSPLQLNSKERAFAIGKRIDQNLNATNSESLLKLLQSLTLDRLLEAGKPDSSVYGNWVTVLTSDAHCNKPPADAFQFGSFFKVPLLMGFNSEESLFYLDNPSTVQHLAKAYDSNPKLILDILDVAENDPVQVAKELKAIYTNKTFAEDLPAFAKYYSDFSFTNAILRHAETAAKHVSVYLYQFSFLSSATPKSVIPDIEGAGHGDDISFYWRNAFYNIPDSEQYIVKRFMKIISNFLNTKNPTPQADAILENVTWTAVQPNNLSYLNFGRNMTIQKDPRQYHQVKAVLDKYLKMPIYVY